MHIPTIKKLIEAVDLAGLKAAEEAILEEQIPKVEIPGADEGEQLTHVIAAIWIKEDMEANGTKLMDSLREYTKKVRKSID
ncbi:MAG: hypothetical protein ACI9JN_000493 [Bacteroidia bacterium]|jgi:hypothetical protein